MASWVPWYRAAGTGREQHILISTGVLGELAAAHQAGGPYLKVLCWGDKIQQTQHSSTGLLEVATALTLLSFLGVLSPKLLKQMKMKKP